MSWYDYFLGSIAPPTPAPRKRTTSISLEPDFDINAPFQTTLPSRSLGEIGIQPDVISGLPKFSTAPTKPVKPKPPGLQELIAEPIASAADWALTPTAPKEEEDVIKQAEKLGYIPSLLADWYVEGSSSPIGAVGNLPAIGPFAKGGLTAAAKIASSLGGAKGGGALLAGMPFFKLAKQVERTIPGNELLTGSNKVKGLQEINDKPVLFRGDPGVTWGNKPTNYEFVNPQFYNRKDTLGWMTHAAEEPKYPERSYAYKHGSPIRPTQMESHSYNPEARPNLTAITSTAENAIDLTRIPVGEDYDKLIRGLEQWDPRRSPFGEFGERVTRERAREIIKQLPAAARKQAEADLRALEPKKKFDLADDPNPYGWDKQNRESLMVDARAVLNDPDIAARTGWDAIRYDDAGEMSWAFPDIGKLETPWGTKIGRSSMGQFPYRLKSGADMPYHPNWRTEDESVIGHYATPKQAAREGIRRGLKPNDIDIYLGEHLISRPDSGLGPGGLQEYLANDKKITKHAPKDDMAMKLYGDYYNNISAYGKSVIDKTFEQKFKQTYHKPPVSKAKNALANSLYGADYDKIGATAQNAVDDHIMGNKIYGTGKSIDEPYGLSDKEGEYLTSPESLAEFLAGSEPLDATPGQIQKFKNEGVSYNSVADHFFDEKYKDLTEAQQKQVKDFTDWIEKGASPKSILAPKSTNDSTVVSVAKKNEGIQTYNVTVGDLKKFVAKNAGLDAIAEHYYGKNYDNLLPGEAVFIWDIKNKVMDFEGKKSVAASNKTLEDKYGVGSVKISPKEPSYDWEWDDMLNKSVPVTKSNLSTESSLNASSDEVEHFKKKNGTTNDEIAKYFFNKPYGSLSMHLQKQVNDFYDTIHPVVSFPNKKK